MKKKHLQQFYIIDKKRLANDIENSCNCACVCSTLYSGVAKRSRQYSKTLKNLTLIKFHYTRWPNTLDISLYMNVECSIVKSREGLARALNLNLTQNSNSKTSKTQLNRIAHKKIKRNLYIRIRSCEPWSFTTHFSNILTRSDMIFEKLSWNPVSSASL